MENQIKGKTAEESYTEHSQILLSAHMNGAGRLFGGQLLQWIDIAAAVCARRHSEHNVTTAAISGLDFLGPAYMNNTVVLCARIVSCGRTSMEVRVDTFAERLSGERKMVNRAYLTMVALDKDEKPTPVPPYIPVTKEDFAELELAKCRREESKRRAICNL